MSPVFTALGIVGQSRCPESTTNNNSSMHWVIGGLICLYYPHNQLFILDIPHGPGHRLNADGDVVTAAGNTRYAGWVT